MPPKLKASSKTQTVKVVVRCRPSNSKQTTHDLVVSVNEADRTITVKNPNPQKSNMPPTRDFTFDSVFAPTCKQESIFDDSALPIIQSVLEGYNGTIFAYGQTGTGKTHTMEGSQGDQRGIVPRAISYVFKAIEGAAQTKKYLVRTTFLQLYNEELIDLLVNPVKGQKKDKKPLQIHQRPNEGIKVFGLSEFVIENQKQITHKYNIGKSHRVVAQTQMNATSSRSHSIFSIIIENQEEVNGKVLTKAGKLNLVDLAGSQRQSKTGVTGVQRQQAININLSLTTLGLVIQTLVNPKASHVPYRDSKLTRLLQDSLGGNTKTVMIANVGPSGYNYEQTLSTLKYASRAKNIKNDVRINEDPKDALLRQFQEEIKRLRQQVALSMGGVIPGAVQQRIIEEEDVEQFQEKLRSDQQAIKRKFQQQKAEIYKKKDIIEEEKNKLLKQIEEKEKQQNTYKQNQQALFKKLKKMQEKVLHGNVEQEAALQKAQQLKRKLQQLEQKREKQRQIQQDLREKDNIMDNANKMYKSMQQQNQDKSVQIKQKMRRLKNLQNQNKQLEEMYAQQIEELQQRRRILQKQLKLKNFVIDYFVPAQYIEMINEKVVWNEEHDDWFLPNLDISGNSLRHKNPQTFDQNDDIGEEQLQELKVNQMAKLQLQTHPNVYYTYSEQGLIRQLEPQTKKPKKTKKRPASKRKN